MSQNEYTRVAEYIERSNLPRKQDKLGGLRRAELKQIRITLARIGDLETLLVDGIAADWSELENGYWL